MKKYKILLSLSKLSNSLSKLGFIQESDDIATLIENLLKEMTEGKNSQESNDLGDFASKLVGLQESGTPLHNMNQGFTLEPFFSNYGDLG